MDNFIVPPRFNRKHIVYGFTVWEGFAIIGLIILTFFTWKPVFIPIAAIVAGISFRRPGSDMNAKTYLKILFNYYKSMQVYSLRECDPR